MTTDLDFDARLRARLERLDAAIPAAAPPVTVSVGVAGNATPAAHARSRSRGGRRRLIPLLAAAVLLVAGSAVTAQRVLYPEEVPEPRLEAALAEVLAAGDGCLSAAEARPAIQAKLDALGYADWEIEGRAGTDTSRCTAAGLDVSVHVVLLLPAAGRELADALAALSNELGVQSCLNRADAMALLSSVVVSNGVIDFDIRADPWGPGPQVPLDKADAYMAHAGDGCTMYAGMGWDEGGKPQFYLSGPWP